MKKIEKVNTGLCHRRCQTGEPPFYVNWQENGENKGEFFRQRFAAEAFSDRLKKAARDLDL
jgi:hypothetical protein